MECVIAEVSTVSVFSRVCLYISLVRYMLCKCVVIVVERLDQFFFFFFKLARALFSFCRLAPSQCERHLLEFGAGNAECN